MVRVVVIVLMLLLPMTMTMMLLLVMVMVMMIVMLVVVDDYTNLAANIVTLRRVPPVHDTDALWPDGEG